MNKYKKLLIRNTFLICLVFSVLFSLIFHIERYSFSKSAYTDRAEQSVKFISGTLDNSFSKLQDLSVLFYEDETIAEYVESTSPTPLQRKTLNKYLYSAISSMPSTTSSVFMTQPDDNYIISATSLMDISFFAKTYGLNIEDITSLISEENTNVAPYVFFTHSGNEYYYTTALRCNTSYGENYVIFLVNNMKELLSTIPEGTSLLISQSDSPLYFSGDFSQEELNTIISGETPPGYTTVASYSTMTSFFGNLSYTLIIPERLYYSHVNKHLIFTALSFILLFIASIILSRGVSRKTYSPIDRLVTQVSEISTETSENEIEAISSVISLLSKKNSELDAIVKSSHTSLKEKFLNDLLHGHLSKERICEGIELYMPDIESVPHIYVIILGSDFEYQNQNEDTEIIQSYYGVIQTLLRHEFTDSKFFHLTTITPFVHGIVISCNNIETLAERLKNLLLNIEIDFGINLCSTISDEVLFWEKLPHILLTTYYRHTSNRLGSTAKTVVTAGENNFAVMYSPELENEIYTSCVRHNKDKLHSSLELLLKENFSNNSNFAEIRSQLSTLLHTLCVKVCTFTGIDFDNIFGSDFNIYHQMKHSKDFAEFSNNIYTIFEKISDEIKNLQSIDEHNYSENMIEYIHQNYDRDVSLYDLATYMNMSQAYVSRLFKKLTGYNFKDYLAKVRIEKALSLLVENPSASIQDIASMVGYNNAKPFTALFIKTMGVTPSEYRKMHKKS